MNEVNPRNERTKRRYFRYLREARGLAESTVNLAALALAEFEKFTSYADFIKFTSKQAMSFKLHLRRGGGKRAAELSSRATVVSKARQVQQFFRWLAEQDGYRSRIRHCDLDYFNVTRREAKLSQTRRAKPAPIVDQALAVIAAMPATTNVQMRDRAVVALALLTGIRVKALSTLRLKHVRSDRLGIDQDAREMDIKGSKTQTTFFFPVCDSVKDIFMHYVDHHKSELGWGRDDPLFPASKRTVGADRHFRYLELSRSPWKTTDPIRAIFKRAFAAAEIPYFSPHTFRACLTTLGEQICNGPEQLKAWSQNAGHDEVLTTLTSYGAVPLERQAELLIGLNRKNKEPEAALTKLREIMTQPGVAALLGVKLND